MILSVGSQKKNLPEVDLNMDCLPVKSSVALVCVPIAAGSRSNFLCIN